MVVRDELIPLDSETFTTRYYRGAFEGNGASKPYWDNAMRFDILVRYGWRYLSRVFHGGQLHSFEVNYEAAPYHKAADAGGVDGLIESGVRRLYPYAFRLHREFRVRSAWDQNVVTFRYSTASGEPREFRVLEQFCDSDIPYGTLFPAYYIQLYLTRAGTVFRVEHVVLFETMRFLRWFRACEQAGDALRQRWMGVNRADGNRYLEIPLRVMAENQLLTCLWSRAL